MPSFENVKQIMVTVKTPEGMKTVEMSCQNMTDADILTVALRYLNVNTTLNKFKPSDYKVTSWEIKSELTGLDKGLYFKSL